jgi:hypothetical protein
LLTEAKFGIFAGSALSATAGIFVLRGAVLAAAGF